MPGPDQVNAQDTHRTDPMEAGLCDHMPPINTASSPF